MSAQDDRDSKASASLEKCEPLFSASRIFWQVVVLRAGETLWVAKWMRPAPGYKKLNLHLTAKRKRH
jgi:hypothetical protein